jgi:hypothetical protein
MLRRLNVFLLKENAEYYRHLTHFPSNLQEIYPISGI